MFMRVHAQQSWNQVSTPLRQANKLVNKMLWCKAFGCYNNKGQCVWRSVSLIAWSYKSLQITVKLYCRWNQWQTHTDTKPHTTTRLSQQTQADQSRLTPHCSTQCPNVYSADTLKDGYQWKCQSGKQMTYSMTHLSGDKLVEVFKTLLWSRHASLKLAQRVEF